MELLIVVALVGAFYYIKSREQQQRIALLGGHLSRFDIEKLMESLMEGYLRALGEGRVERQAQVWDHLKAQEDRLCEQFRQFSSAFHEVWADSALVSTLPIGLPWAHKLFPAHTFDARKVLQIHAQGLEDAIRSTQTADPKGRAFTITAELMLMQHSCHWFCRSKTVASARLLARHKTRYEQVLAAVTPSTRNAYNRLVTRQR